MYVEKVAILLITCLTEQHFELGTVGSLATSLPNVTVESLPSALPNATVELGSPKDSTIKYKNSSARPLAARPFVPTDETFLAAAVARSPSDIPPIPWWNTPPDEHVPEATPLFIGFTRNWPLLQQTVVSFITAGWPPSDIYVVENTGVMNANEKGQLSLQNPFYLDHHRLRNILQVNVLVTPSLQTFAQLQNFYLYHAMSKQWPHYFWAHMDILVQNSEARSPYLSFYSKAVNLLRRPDGEKPWAIKFLAYDWVALMNTEAMVTLRGWDTWIPYYTIDCDMYERMRMSNYSTDAVDCGPVYDTGESLPDLQTLYRIGGGDSLNSTAFHELQATAKDMARRKNNASLGPRNRWQGAQMGGQGEPWYRDADGFAEALELHVQAGIKVYGAKWHARGCGLRGSGLKAEDEWLVDSIDYGET